MTLLLLLGCAGGVGADSAPGVDLPATPEAFCAELTPSDDADAVGLSCMDAPTAGQACDAIDVEMVDKGSVDALCATCDANGAPCVHTDAVNCTTTEGATLSVYSFSCG